MKIYFYPIFCKVSLGTLLENSSSKIEVETWLHKVFGLVVNLAIYYLALLFWMSECQNVTFRPHVYFTQKALKRHVYKKARTSKHCVVVLIYAASVYTFTGLSEHMGTLGILDLGICNDGGWGRLCPMHSHVPNWFENIPSGLIHRYTAKKLVPVVQFYFYCNLCLETEKCLVFEN